MSRITNQVLPVLSLMLLPALSWAAPVAELAPRAGFQACFAPGTSEAYVREVSERAALRGFLTSLNASIRRPRFLEQQVYGTPEHYDFNDSDRWTHTATDGGGLVRAQPLTLTWSIVPDTTPIPGFNGETAANSNLIAALNAVYGAGSDGKGQGTWRDHFQTVFDRWSELSGITYVYEANDDGAAFSNSVTWNGSEFVSTVPGQLGVRGDVRIGGHDIDGGGAGVLAYNFYPVIGDMVIDTSDIAGGQVLANPVLLRNTLSHEHGHGLGFGHVCPTNATKLMEPFVSGAFEGPQLDDILAVHRGYGDPREANGSFPGTGLGVVSSTSLNDVSLDGQTDVDVFSFTANPNSTLNVTATPTGTTYNVVNANSNGSCPTDSPFDSLNLRDLIVEVLDTNGSTVLTTVNATGVGSAEMLASFLLSGGGTYGIRVSSAVAAVVVPQRYTLSLSLSAGPAAEDLNADGKVDSLDLGILMSQWGGGAGSSANLNGDGTVNGADLDLMLTAMGF